MKQLLTLYRQFSGHDPDRMELIPLSVSARKYYRIFDGDKTVIGTYSPDFKETKAFVTFSAHFLKKGISVPEVYAISDDKLFYLQEDLGGSSMHDLVMGLKIEERFSDMSPYYKKAIDQLIKLQLEGHEGVDYSVCVPRQKFDKQSILWDLNHFKYYFLKFSGITFDEQKLEEAFLDFADRLSALDMESFMFRDFQTRNIMLKDDELTFIDFQGGRQGPLQYDLASLVFEARVDMDMDLRSELVKYYMDSLEKYRKINRKQFKEEFYQVAIIRILQALGAYGLRGTIEKNVIFLQSIPIGLKNLHCVLRNIDVLSLPPYLSEILHQLADKKMDYPQTPGAFDGLSLTITSFSYRKNIPDDITGNGGGFVFDCRFIHNPGRYEEYRDFTGLDSEIHEFFKEKSSMDEFLDQVTKQINDAVGSYKELGYKNLMISFGCTGGKHRSVYATKMISERFRNEKDIRVIESHRELGLKF